MQSLPCDEIEHSNGTLHGGSADEAWVLRVDGERENRRRQRMGVEQLVIVCVVDLESTIDRGGDEARESFAMDARKSARRHSLPSAQPTS